MKKVYPRTNRENITKLKQPIGEGVYTDKERRGFVRLSYSVPLDFKVCKRKTISRLLEGYTSDISQSGVLCNIKDKVKKGDIIWLCFDRATLNICAELEKRAFIYQGGIVGRVARVGSKGNKTYDVGIQFIARKEDNLTHIYPKAHFIKQELESK